CGLTNRGDGTATRRVLACPPKQRLVAPLRDRGTLLDGFWCAAACRVLCGPGNRRHSLGEEHGTRRYSHLSQLAHQGHFLGTRSGRPVCHFGNCGADEHLREVLESRDVWLAHEHGVAVLRAHSERSGADAVQVWQAARLPAGLGALPHETSRVL